MLERGGRAHVLNTASMGGLMPIPGVGAYCASKFASVGLSMVLREELKGTDISVSVLTPGTVATGMNPGGADPDRVGEQVVEALEAKRFLIPTHGDFEPILAGIHREIEQAFADTDDRHGPDPSAQMLFSGRFLVQWIASERAGVSVVPISFWCLSIIGGLLLLGYAIRRRDPVFIVGQATGVLVYARNLVLIWKSKTRQYAPSESSQAVPGQV